MYGRVSAFSSVLWMYIHAHQRYAIRSFIVHEIHLRAFQHKIIIIIITYCCWPVELYTQHMHTCTHTHGNGNVDVDVDRGHTFFIASAFYDSRLRIFVFKLT